VIDDSGEIVNWPEPVETGQYTPSVVVSSLPPETKAAVWGHLKRAHPLEARRIQLMMRDAGVQRLIREFGGGLLIETEYIHPIITLNNGESQ
jgi:hypothetical protein